MGSIRRIRRQPGYHEEVGSLLSNHQILRGKRSVGLGCHHVEILGEGSSADAVVGSDSHDVLGEGGQPLDGDLGVGGVGCLSLQLGPVVLSDDLVLVVDDVPVTLGAFDRLPLEGERPLEGIGLFEVKWRSTGWLLLGRHFLRLFGAELGGSCSDADLVERVGKETRDGVVQVLVVIDSHEVSADVARLFFGTGQSVLQPVADVIADDGSSLDERSQPLDVHFVGGKGFDSKVSYRSRGSLSGGDGLFGRPGAGSDLVGGAELDDPSLVGLGGEGVLRLVAGDL